MSEVYGDDHHSDEASGEDMKESGQTTGEWINQYLTSFNATILRSERFHWVRDRAVGLMAMISSSKIYITFRGRIRSSASKVKESSVFTSMSERWSKIQSTVKNSKHFRSVTQHTEHYASVFKTSKKHQSIALAFLLVSLSLSAFVLHGVMDNESSEDELESTFDLDMSFTLPSDLSLVSNTSLEVDSSGGVIESSGVSMAFGAGALNETLNLSLEVFEPPANLNQISTSPVLSTYAVHLDVNETARLNGSIRLTLPAIDGVADNPQGIVLGVVRGGIVVPQNIPMRYNWTSGNLQADLELGTLFPSELLVLDSPHFAGGLISGAAAWGAWLYQNKEALVATRDCGWESFFGGQSVRIHDSHLDLLVPNQLGENSYDRAQYLFDGKLWETRIVLTNHLDLYVPTIKGKQGKADPYDICWVHFSEYDALPNGASGLTLPSSPHYQGMSFVNVASTGRHQTTIHEYVHGLSPSVWNDNLISNLAGMSLESKIPYVKEIPKYATMATNLVKWQPQVVAENQWFFEGSTVAMTRHLYNGTPGIDKAWPVAYQYQTNLGNQSFPPEASQAFFAWLDQRVQGDDSRDGISRFYEFRVLYEGVKFQPERSVAEDALDYFAQWYLRGDAGAGDIFRLHLEDMFGAGRTSGFYGDVQDPRLLLTETDCKAESTLEPFSFDVIRSSSTFEPMFEGGGGVWVLPIQSDIKSVGWKKLDPGKQFVDVMENQSVDIVMFHDGVETREDIEITIDVCPIDEEENGPEEPSGPTWTLTNSFMLGSGGPLQFEAECWERNSCDSWYYQTNYWNWSWTYDITGFTLTGYNVSNPEENWTAEYYLPNGMPTSFTEHDGDRNITALIQMEIRYIETPSECFGQFDDCHGEGRTNLTTAEIWRDRQTVTLYAGPSGVLPSNNATWVTSPEDWYAFTGICRKNGEVLSDYKPCTQNWFEFSRGRLSTYDGNYSNPTLEFNGSLNALGPNTPISVWGDWIEFPEDNPQPESFWVVLSPSYPYGKFYPFKPPCDWCGGEDHHDRGRMIEGHGVVFEYTRS